MRLAVNVQHELLSKAVVLDLFLSFSNCISTRIILSTQQVVEAGL